MQLSSEATGRVFPFLKSASAVSVICLQQAEWKAALTVLRDMV